MQNEFLARKVNRMATTDGTRVTIAGRLVWGHPCKQRARTDNNNKPIIKADGTPAMQYIYGLAVPKADFMNVLWPVMQAEAMKGYPQGAPQNFAWKYDDGDDTRPVNGGGVPYAQREGYPGCYVITVASSLPNPPPVFKFNAQTGGYDQLTAESFKTGDYIATALNVTCNVPEQRTHTPSLYLNPEGIEVIGYGTEIASVAAINPMQAFGGRQHQLPPGASATPISSAPAGVSMPGVPGAPQQMQPAPGYPAPAAPQQMQPAPGYPAPAAPQQMQPAPGYPAPAHDFVQNAGYPAPGMPGGMPPR